MGALTSDLLPCANCGGGVTPALSGGVSQCGHCGASLSAYTHELRLLLCDHCGALLNVEVAGGLVRCAYCHSTSTFPARNEVREYAEPAAAQMSEPQRLMMLAQQSRFSLPNGFSGTDLPEQWKGEERAWPVWQSMRAERAPDGMAVNQEGLFKLTCYLHRRLAFRNQTHRQRALLESAVEVTARPLYRQLLRCMLARNAAQHGDVKAAREWLAPCNPRPLDKYMDSAYRLAAAAVETERSRFDSVWELLGRQPDAIPIAASYEGLTDLYRANALEKVGHLDAAVDLLIDNLKGFRNPRSGAYIAGYYSDLVVAFVLHQHSSLCSHSFPQAYEQAFGSPIHECVTWNAAEGSVSMRRPKGAQRKLLALLALVILLPLMACGVLALLVSLL